VCHGYEDIISTDYGKRSDERRFGLCSDGPVIVHRDHVTGRKSLMNHHEFWFIVEHVPSVYRLTIREHFGDSSRWIQDIPNELDCLVGRHVQSS
jgi:hypothetical protein